MPPNPQTVAAVRTRLERWKRQLIDLTRRNRLLNYRPTKVSTVEVVDEVPQAVVRQILEGSRFFFDPVPEEENTEDPTTPDETAQAEADGTPRTRMSEENKEIETDASREAAGQRLRDEAEDDAERPSPANEDGDQAEEPTLTARDRSRIRGEEIRRTRGQVLDERHTDDRLQTPHSEKVLKRNLLRIYRTAASSIEEQGVNTLFLAVGMLKWYEDPESDVVNRAPVLLVPVTLDRLDASSPFVLTLGDDEPVLNPALQERLRHDFGIILPALPELSEELELDDVFFGVKKAVKGFPRWKVTNDMALGLFSFQKFIMYRDMEENEEHYTGHTMIQNLSGVGGEAPIAGLPGDVKNADLDEEMAPWSSVQVLDADSSQQRAMLAVRKEYPLVIEGPPGTGKSQTITNIIADALSEDKTVLFVSEKMAALEVVKSRLESVELGHFCLELHSHKTAKTEFVRSLARSLAMEAAPPDPEDDKRLRRLEELSRRLGQYAALLHEPVPPLNKTPFQAIDALVEAQEAELIRVDIPDIESVTDGQYTELLRVLQEFAEARRVTGPPSEHPYRGCGLTRTGRTTRDELAPSLSTAAEHLSKLEEQAGALAGEVGFASPGSFADVALLIEGAQVVAGSPGTEEAVLQNNRWNELSADVEELLKTGSKYSSLQAHVSDKVLSRALEDDLKRELEDCEHYLSDGLRFFKWSYWKLRGELKRCLQPSFRPDDGMKGTLSVLKQAQRARNLRLQLEDQEEMGRELFGSKWQGPQSDWVTLREFAEWVVQVRQYALKEALTARGMELAAHGGLPSASINTQARELQEQLEITRRALRELGNLAELDAAESGIDPSAEALIASVSARLEEMQTNLGSLGDWTRLQAAYQRLRKGATGPFIEDAMRRDLAGETVLGSFRRVFLRHWLDFVMEERPVLGSFRADLHENRIQEFRQLDRLSKYIARRRARARLLDRRQNLLSDDLGHQLQIVQREARKSRRIRPVRKLLREAPAVIQRINPCFMMSPLSVAQYVDPNVMKFDLVVFDEASQITPADAVGSVIRGDQLVVVGDSKQLPPTDFFSVQVEESDDLDPDVDDVMVIHDDLESILDEVSTAGVSSLRLKWHYRSEDESLIRFSNEEFYAEDPLYTFPSVERKGSARGLQFEYLPDARYDGGGVNHAEARAIADAVVQHIQETPELSLGVGTFGIKQQTLIQDELDTRRREIPSIEHFFARGDEEKFFVKNLENIQGDDRDVIFLSVTYGPDQAGVIRRNFGPINNANGWRRLNVITTRAKKCLRIFSSMRGDDIDVSGGVAQGVTLLHRYLKYAETGQYPTRDIGNAEPDSEFERQVIRVLEERGYQVVPQVGEAGYRVDIGVLDRQNPGRFICGVECDGASYHSAATVRDRDRLRQQVLELRGWTIHRVWSTDWFHDPEGQTNRLLRLIESTAREKRTDTQPRSSTLESREPAVPTPFQSRPSEPSGIGQGLNDSSKPPIESIEIATYTVAEPTRVCSPDAFYESSDRALAQTVAEILAIETPIHRAELARRTATWYGMARTGSRIRERVDASVDWLVSRGQVEAKGEFVWMEGKVVPRRRDGDGVSSRAEELPPQEIRAAIRLLLTHRAPLLQDEIVPETARLLGFKRTGSKLSAVIGSVLTSLIDAGEVRPGVLGVELATDESEESGAPEATEPPEVTVTPPPSRRPSTVADVEPPRAEGFERQAAESSQASKDELCPICSEDPIDANYRGMGLCTRCMKELRG